MSNLKKLSKISRAKAYVAVCCIELHCVALCCSALQCVAVCCSVLQCVAVYCIVLQRVYTCEGVSHMKGLCDTNEL